MAAAGRHIREPLSRWPEAGRDREGAREHAPEAPEDTLRERASGDAVLRPAEARRVPRHVSQRQRRDLGHAAGSRPRAAAVARVPDQVSGPDSDGIRRVAEPRSRRILAPALAVSRNLRRVLLPPGADSHARRLAWSRTLEHLGNRLARCRVAEDLLPECGAPHSIAAAVNRTAARGARTVTRVKCHAYRIAFPTPFRDRHACHRPCRVDGGTGAVAGLHAVAGTSPGRLRVGLHRTRYLARDADPTMADHDRARVCHAARRGR